MYPLIWGELTNSKPVNLSELTSSDNIWQPPDSFYQLHKSHLKRNFLGRIKSNQSIMTRVPTATFYVVPGTAMSFLYRHTFQSQSDVQQATVCID